MKVYTTTEIFKHAQKGINDILLTAHENARELQERYKISEEESNKIMAIILSSAFNRFVEDLNK